MIKNFGVCFYASQWKKALKSLYEPRDSCQRYLGFLVLQGITTRGFLVSLRLCMVNENSQELRNIF